MELEAARQVLLTHARDQGRELTSFTHAARLTNPVCGDHVELRLQIESERVVECGHVASACAICTASASLLASTARGLATAEIAAWPEAFERAVVGGEWPASLAPFACFEHLQVNPARRMCALLPFVVLRKALA